MQRVNFQEDANGVPIDLAAEPERVSAYREAAETFMGFFARAITWTANSRANRGMAFDCMCFATGNGQLLGIRSEVDLASRHGVTKQAICKMVKNFQETVRVPPMPGQRREEAIPKFREARMAQLMRNERLNR